MIRRRTAALAAALPIGAVALFLLAACQGPPSAPGPTLDGPAAPDGAAAPAGDRPATAVPSLSGSSRTELREGIAHYTFDLTLGPGEFDVVRLHRVVAERRPDDPARSVDGVFLLPGAPNSWVQIFMEPLVSEVPRWDRSVAIFLAKNGVDVWGIDYAWARVPMETADFGFMRGWGIGRDIGHAREALAAARSIRASTGQGNGRLHLLGFSYGGPVGYGILGRETRLPPGQRMVKGFVAVDTEVKLRDPERRAGACETALENREAIASGTFHNSMAAGLIQLAGLAASAPDEPSPVVPSLTNLQFILSVTAGGIPHFVGGTFDESGVPTGLRFTEPALWLDVLLATRPHWPLQASTDVAFSRCETEDDVAFDDHLSDITVPILYVGAAGGTGEAGVHTASLTSSRDVEAHVVQLLPTSERAFDFGHADLFTGTDAASLAWQPILDWILGHREGRTRPIEARP